MKAALKAWSGRVLTLVELLVAISLLSIVTVLAYRGLDGIRRSQARAAAEGRHWQAIARSFERFRSDVLQASPRPCHRLDGSLEPAWLGTAAGTGEASLALTRKPVAEGQDEQRLGYRLRQGRLELLLWPSLDALPEADLRAAPEAYDLLDGVTALELTYLSADQGWLDHWPPKGPPKVDDDPGRRPRAVLLRLTLADGTDFQRIFALP